MPRRIYLFLLVFVGMLGMAGCKPNEIQQSLSIDGIVGSTQQEIEKSLIRETAKLTDDELPIHNATVYISLDKKGQRVAANSVTDTDVKGAYRIELSGLQPPDSADGYYIHISKPGFTKFSRVIGMEPARFQHNTVILKTMPK